MQDRIKDFLKNIKLNESMLSMLLGLVTIVVVGLLVFNFYRQDRTTEDIADTGEQTAEMVGDVEVVTGDDGEKYPADLSETYVVVEGDHLWGIAEANYGSGYNWVDISRENNLMNSDRVLVGQVLMLPKTPVIVIDAMMADEVMMKPGQTVIEGSEYTVVEGDNLWDISVRAYQDGYRWPDLARENNIANPDVIVVGQILTLAR